MSANCRLCGKGPLTTLSVPERHFGTGENYEYELCGSCQSLQIAEIPADLSKYYPKGYYSLQSQWEAKLRHPLRKLAKRLRDGFELSGSGLVGRLLAMRSRYPEMTSLSSLGLQKHWRILDVGCGDGFILWSLANLGFSDLTGVDPNLAADKAWPGVALLKLELKEVTGAFDLLTFHHSLEHLSDPAAALAQAAKLLKPGGLCLVRVPTSDSEAFKRYREFWIQIDAPRHLHLMSRSALRALGESAGLSFVRSWDDSNAFQFWGSEQAREGVALEDPRSKSFGEAQMKAWEEEARRLNREGKGDSIAVLFQRPT